MPFIFSDDDGGLRDEGSMFGPKPGSWWVHSKSDPRWDCHGRDRVGGFACPPNAEAAIEAKKRELGCEPPDDLEYGYMKD
jgi:hypothetical protein